MIHSYAAAKTSLTWSTLYTKAMSAELADSTVVRELSLSVKKFPSNIMGNLLEDLETVSTLDLANIRASLSTLLASHGSTGAPLRSEHDLDHSTLRTTVIAQKVSLSKEQATLSAQDKEYSKLVNRIDLALREFFTEHLINPKELVLHEVLMFDSKGTCREALGAQPRQAIERALSTPHDYLACDCCEGKEALSASQPATAILYQLYLESGALINVADLWAAFQAILSPGREEDEEASEEEL